MVGYGWESPSNPSTIYQSRTLSDGVVEMVRCNVRVKTLLATPCELNNKVSTRVCWAATRGV